MSVEIATPYSDLFQNISARKAIIAESDLVEVRHPCQAGTLEVRELFHCEHSIVAPWGNHEISQLISAAEKTAFEAVSFHVSSRYAENKIVSGVFHGLGKPMSVETMFDNACQNIEKARKIFGSSSIFLIENNNYFCSDAYNLITEPDFLSELIDITGADLLLDIAHARISAQNLHNSEQDYLGRLPLYKCSQVHISRHGVSGEMAIDAHDDLQDEDWQYFRALARNSLPNMRYVTVEYYKDCDILKTMLRNLRIIINDLGDRRR